jgi:hypothetical protein
VGRDTLIDEVGAKTETETEIDSSVAARERLWNQVRTLDLRSSQPSAFSIQTADFNTQKALNAEG